MTSQPDPATRYARAVVAGEVAACVWTRRACQRHLDDLHRALAHDQGNGDTEKRAHGETRNPVSDSPHPRVSDSPFPWTWDVDRVGRVVRFFRLLRHYKGPLAGQPFILEPWQCFALGSIFGWRHVDSGVRRFRRALISVPRGNGKTTMCGGVATYLLAGDGEAGPEVYTVATREEQAKICWKDAVRFVQASPELSGILRCKVNVVVDEGKAGELKYLGSDSKRQDGLNPHGVIADELHAWPAGRGSELWDVVREAMVKRAQPLIVAITTEGYFEEGVYRDEQAYGRQVLQGVIEDDRVFCLEYGLDEGDDPWDERLWAKANPCLGTAKDLESMRDEARQAQGKPSQVRSFLTKQLNIRTSAAGAWLDLEKWDGLADEGKRGSGDTEMGGWMATLPQGARCWIGVDLSTRVDLTAVAALVELPDSPTPPLSVSPQFAVLMRFFVPEERIEQRGRNDRVPYPQWAAQGWLTATEGSVVDYSAVRASIADLAGRFAVQGVGSDPWQAQETMTIMAEEMGLPVVEVRQGFATLSEPSKELEALITSGALVHEGNPVMRWMVSHCVVRTDPADNIKPDKAKSRERIDGVAALVNALAVKMATVDAGEPSVFVF